MQRHSYESILREAKSSLNEPELKSDWQITKLAGDASLRKYFRLDRKNESYVLLQTEAFDPLKYDFLLVRDFLETRGIAVPRVFSVDGGAGTILLEDLGNRTLLHALGESHGIGEEEKYYERSIQLIVDFHANTQAAPGEVPVPGFRLAFDEEKLMWEVDFALKHLFGSYLKRQIPADEFQEIRDGFEQIVKELVAEPRVFTHRDYHSRNLMLTSDDRLICIDFQDARMGLRAYDIASLLRDSYYQLSDERVSNLIDFYLARVKEQEGVALDKWHFLRTFDLMSIQRNFKAIGSFTSFLGNRNDPSYIRFVGNTFENIRRNLEKFPEYETLRKKLFYYYYF